MPCESLSPVLIVLILLPLATAIGVACLGARQGDRVRRVSLISTLVSLVLSLIIAWNFAAARSGSSEPLDGFKPGMVTRVDLLTLQGPDADQSKKPGGDEKTAPTYSGIQFYIGLDGLNVWLILLTSLLMVTAVLSSWTSVHERVNEYYAWMLVLQTAMVGVFLSFDIILFYVFFELTLVPLFFLIGIWGGPQRQYAARKFFVFTLAGSLITLLGVLAVVLIHYTVGYHGPDGEIHKELTFSIPRLVELTQAAMNSTDAADVQYWLQVQYWVFIAMIVGFSVKVPLVPVHTWLPLAHVEAPTAGSVLLAGVLLKIGSYGFLRLAIPLAPDASLTVGAPLIGGLAVVGIIYGAFCALQQDDIKKMVAYSSVSHMGICMLGLFSLNQVGMAGGYLQMLNHGLSTGALFLLVGMLYERYHTRKIVDYGGMAAKLKLLAFAFVFITMSSIGLPGLNGFWGEWFSLAGMFGSQATTVDGVMLSAFGAVGVVLGAWYMLSLVRDVFFGEFREPHHEGHEVPDMNGREIALMAPIAVACLLIGLVPSLVMKPAEPELLYVAKLTDDARARLKTREADEGQARNTQEFGGGSKTTQGERRGVSPPEITRRANAAPLALSDPALTNLMREDQP